MTTRTRSQIIQDIRSCYSNAAIGTELKDKEIVDHFTREAQAYERELELLTTGYVLTTA